MQNKEIRISVNFLKIHCIFINVNRAVKYNITHNKTIKEAFPKITDWLYRTNKRHDNKRESGLIVNKIYSKNILLLRNKLNSKTNP